MDAATVVIATDDNRIARVATAFGANVEMTSSECPTGTDRVAEVALRHPADWYVNIQGDEPFVDPAAIQTIIKATDDAASEVAAVNTMSIIADQAVFRSETVPKPVTDIRGRLLYVSRAAIPTDMKHGFPTAFRQVGLYAFRTSELELYRPGAKKSPLEEIEDTEILRVIEAGLRVQMVTVPTSGIAVDTQQDLERARLQLTTTKE